MAEPLSYNDLEKLVSELKKEKQEINDLLISREKQFNISENLYKQIINNTNEGVFVIQGEKFTFINQVALNILETTKKDIKGAKFFDIVHTEYQADLIQQISRVIEGTAAKFECKIQLINFTGKIIDTKITAEKLFMNTSQSSILIKITNIDDLVKKEGEISVLNEKLNLHTKYSDEVFIILERSLNEESSVLTWEIKDINPAGLRLFKKDKNQVLGENLGKFIELSFDYKIPQQINEKFDDSFEPYIRNLNKYFQVSFYGISNAKIICKLVDINDFYITKEQLNKNLQRNELFTEILGIFNSDLDYDKKYEKVLDRIAYHFKPNRLYIFRNSKNNEVCKLMLQYNSESVKELPENYSIPMKKVPSLIKNLKERKMLLGFSLDYLPEDVRDYFAGMNLNNAYVFPIVIDDKINGSILFENEPNEEWDNTEINYMRMTSVMVSNLLSRQNYEEKLLTAKDKAEQADKLKSSFLASMSHDIRIPMTAIIGFSDLLADPDLTLGEREEFIDLISKSGQDLLTLVDNIVDVAKIEAGQLRIQTDKYSLGHLLNELYSIHAKDSKLLDHDDLELVVDFPEKYKGLLFETDVFRFKQVFSNLIENAIKFTDKGVIHFGVSNVWNSTIEFYVQDTGIGIAEETQHIIFERFSKIDRNYTKEYSGTGLGLSICKSIIELMGGEIRLISYPGKGSTFYFTHPLPKGAYSVTELDKKEEKGEIKYIWTGKKILIAEDVEQNYRLLEYILNPTGVNIKWAKDGKKALDWVKKGEDVDLILMDIRMPVLNGIDATREILKVKKLPIIAQTAYTFGEEQKMALDAGCIGYLSKPINPDKLLKIVNDVFTDPSIIT